MKTIQLTPEQTVLLMAVLRESCRTTYLDSLATGEDCERIIQLTAHCANQIALDK